MEIRPGRSEEADTISDLALRAKAHWGYPAEFMERCRGELTYTPEQIAAAGTWLAADGAQVLGFYALTKVSPDTLELDALFVEPGHIGTGIGRALMQHALAQFDASGLARLIIQADPNAAGFYEAAGARRIGESPSQSIEGRMLPLYEIDKRDNAIQ